ncbi:MAG: hypothetical protein NTW49_04085 [Bacteroidia bacterium]|nr:hypothetical protein [Bacteroidia bacterium]
MNSLIIEKTSTLSGDKTSGSNHAVALMCLEDPGLLSEISNGLCDKNKKVIADCAEVMTMVAEKNPALVVNFADQLIPLLKNKFTRARWEAVHALALIAGLIPDHIMSVLPEIADLIEKDESVIVRDYSTTMIANFGGAGKMYAEAAYPCLINVLKQWGDRHANRALDGLLNVIRYLPGLKKDILAIASEFTESKKGVNRKSAMKLIKEISKNIS